MLNLSHSLLLILKTVTPTITHYDYKLSGIPDTVAETTKIGNHQETSIISINNILEQTKQKTNSENNEKKNKQTELIKEYLIFKLKSIKEENFDKMFSDYLTVLVILSANKFEYKTFSCVLKKLENEANKNKPNKNKTENCLLKEKIKTANQYFTEGGEQNTIKLFSMVLENNTAQNIVNIFKLTGDINYHLDFILAILRNIGKDNISKIIPSLELQFDIILSLNVETIPHEKLNIIVRAVCYNIITVTNNTISRKEFNSSELVILSYLKSIMLSINTKNLFSPENEPLSLFKNVYNGYNNIVKEQVSCLKYSNSLEYKRFEPDDILLNYTLTKRREELRLEEEEELFYNIRRCKTIICAIKISSHSTKYQEYLTVIQRIIFYENDLKRIQQLYEDFIYDENGEPREYTLDFFYEVLKKAYYLTKENDINCDNITNTAFDSFKTFYKKDDLGHFYLLFSVSPKYISQFNNSYRIGSMYFAYEPYLSSYALRIGTMLFIVEAEEKQRPEFINKEKEAVKTLITTFFNFIFCIRDSIKDYKEYLPDSLKMLILITKLSKKEAFSYLLKEERLLIFIEEMLSIDNERYIKFGNVCEYLKCVNKWFSYNKQYNKNEAKEGITEQIASINYSDTNFNPSLQFLGIKTVLKNSNMETADKLYHLILVEATLKNQNRNYEIDRECLNIGKQFDVLRFLTNFLPTNNNKNNNLSSELKIELNTKDILEELVLILSEQKNFSNIKMTILTTKFSKKLATELFKLDKTNEMFKIFEVQQFLVYYCYTNQSLDTNNLIVGSLFNIYETMESNRNLFEAIKFINKTHLNFKLDTENILSNDNLVNFSINSDIIKFFKRFLDEKEFRSLISESKAGSELIFNILKLYNKFDKTNKFKSVKEGFFNVFLKKGVKEIEKETEGFKELYKKYYEDIFFNN